MRAAPIAFAAESEEGAVSVARAEAELTHFDPAAGDASAALCSALLALTEAAIRSSRPSTLVVGLHAVTAYDDFDGGVRFAVSVARDTDTNAAVRRRFARNPSRGERPT